MLDELASLNSWTSTFEEEGGVGKIANGRKIKDEIISNLLKGKKKEEIIKN